MPPEERMRYYPAVGPAIPHSKAGCSRVTHPFAGCPLRGPLDLHVLSTPPAFVLSQDQTLQEEFHQLSRTAHSNPLLDHHETVRNHKNQRFNSREALCTPSLKRVRLVHSSLDSIFNQQSHRFGGSLKGYSVKLSPSSPVTWSALLAFAFNGRRFGAGRRM